MRKLLSIAIGATCALAACNNDVFIDRPATDEHEYVMANANSSITIDFNHKVNRISYHLYRLDSMGYHQSIYDVETSKYIDLDTLKVDDLVFSNLLLDLKAEYTPDRSLSLQLGYNHYPQPLRAFIYLMEYRDGIPSDFDFSYVAKYIVDIEAGRPLHAGQIDYVTDYWEQSEPEFVKLRTDKYVNHGDTAVRLRYTIAAPFTSSTYFTAQDPQLLQVFKDIPEVPIATIQDNHVVLADSLQPITTRWRSWPYYKIVPSDTVFECEAKTTISAEIFLESIDYTFDYSLPMLDDKEQEILQLQGQMFLRRPTDYRILITHTPNDSIAQ